MTGKRSSVKYILFDRSEGDLKINKKIINSETLLFIIDLQELSL